MKNEEMKNFVENIQNKLGKESASVIMDDLGLLISDTTTMNQMIDSKQSELDKQKSLNEKLIATNSSLLQQVGMNKNGSQDFNSTFGNTQRNIPTQSESQNNLEKISFRDCFDEKGNFKK